MASSTTSSSALSLGWCGVIDTLAESKHELPLLKELILRLPNFFTAAPEPVKERVALRYLEECASRGVLSTKDKRAGTEVSQPTVEFLCQNLAEHIDPSVPSQSRIVPITDDIRQFISQKRSTLPTPSLDLLKNSALQGSDVKLPYTREEFCSSSERQEDNTVEEEQDVIGSPRSAHSAESLHNETSQNSPSQNAIDANKTANDPLHENIPTTVRANQSYSEAAGTEPSSDDMNEFILKRRAAEPKTSIEELKEPTPSTSISTEPSTNENNENLRPNANPKEPIPETNVPNKPSTYRNKENLRSNANQLDDLIDYFMDSQIPFAKQNQCIVCNKGGQLLTCSREGCGISVHENCIMTTPSNFGKEGRFYCPCCACTRAAHAYDRAKKVLYLAKESLSSFLEMEKNQNQVNGGKQKQPVKKNMNGKRKSKRTKFSDRDASEDGDGDTSSSWESASRHSRRRVEKNGRMKERQVQSNDGNVSDDKDILSRRAEGANTHDAHLAFDRLDKYRYCKSGPGATSGAHTVPRDEKTRNEKRKEDRVGAVVNWRRKAAPRYSNKVAAPRRRNVLPWTEEEEQALREGMQKFGVTSDGRIPWSTILEFRRNVFHRTRFPSDLKDKWRNMMKKEGSKA